MADTRRRIPEHVLARYGNERARRKLVRGHWPLPCAWREGDGLALGEAWTPGSKRFAKREVARARRRLGKQEARST